MLARGDYAAAAPAYEEIARSAEGSRATEFRAMAALAYQEAGDTANADALLLTLGEDASRPVVALARARSAVQSGDAREALDLALAADERPLSPYQRGVRARVAGKAALALGENAAAAEAWIDAHRYPYPADSAATVLDSTWRAVSSLPPNALTERANAGDALERGFYTLALTASRTLFDRAAFQQAADEWRQRFPTHPAAGLVETLQERAEAMSVLPRQVALLLPFDDTLGPAARAVRDGFMTAWFGDRSDRSRPDVRIYSSASGDIVSTYRQAVAEGAEFVIGPLRKSGVATLQAQAELDTGVLALNVADEQRATPHLGGFYQFGLTPEDEAAQVARRAHRQGSRALLMAPDSAWGRRVMETYAATWREIGGTVLAEVYFSNASEAYSEAVRRALNIDLSEARSAGLRRVLNVPLHFEPRRRGDVDVILLAGFPDNARQLLPQLRYFRAESVPVFATSHVYAGGTDAERDRDLDGLVFADMPWLFGASDPASFVEIRRNWPNESAGFARLYGLGVDAYRLIPYLARMRFQPSLRVPGATGTLWMDGGGIIHRNVVWLRFDNGVPGLLDASPAATERAL